MATGPLAPALLGACSSTAPASSPGAPRATASTNPADADALNKLWLDLHTDASGNGTVAPATPFATAPGHAPASAVMHEHAHTATAPGQSGTAGNGLACFAAGWS